MARGRKTECFSHALGNPLRMMLTVGQEADMTQACALIEGFVSGVVVVDKGYDANASVQRIDDAEATTLIPSRSNRNEQREYGHHRYKDRNLVERLFYRIKQFRRIAMCYEKLDCHFMSMLSLVCPLI